MVKHSLAFPIDNFAKDKPFNCFCCHSGFDTEEELSAHIQIGHRPYCTGSFNPSCKLCKGHKYCYGTKVTIEYGQ